MVDATMVRPQTSQEARDYTQVGTKTPWELFLRELADAEQKYAKQHKPFDAQCAKQDFKDEIKKIERECERKLGYVVPKDLYAVKLDLEEYGKRERFELLDESEDMQDKIVDGMRTQVSIGWTMKFRCKERGHGVSVFVPTKIYQERFAKKGAKEE